MFITFQILIIFVYQNKFCYQTNCACAVAMDATVYKHSKYRRFSFGVKEAKQLNIDHPLVIFSTPIQTLSLDHNVDCHLPFTEVTFADVAISGVFLTPSFQLRKVWGYSFDHQIRTFFFS